MKVVCHLDPEPRTRTAAFQQRQRKSWRTHAFGKPALFPSCSFSRRGVLARVGMVAGGAIALATACSPAAPTVLEADQEPVALVSAPSAPVVASADTKLGELIERAPESIVAGERPNFGLLRRFYARHDFAPVWTTRQSQANSLINAVLRAGDHGLAPELFHANLLRSPATLPVLDRELLLSNAFLSYADALARGAVPVERRRDDEALVPEPVDIAAALDAAIDSPDPAAAIEALAPDTPTYRRLRQALRSYRAGIPAGGKAATPRLRAIEVNLERERWLPRRLPADRVWVNVADERLVLYRDDRPVFSTRVIVGQDEERNQSPEFEASIDGILFNPPWNIPPDIAANEILPKARHDPNYLARHNMVVLPDGGLQQLAGANSGLGQLMFEMRNRFDVYLHDTPSKNLFSRNDRRISHGCIRVENPRKLAALLMQQPVDAIDQAIATGSTTRSDLPKPVPVFVVYETAFADVDGRLQFRADVYGRDAEIWRSLNPK
ncbi:MAG TPA: L,D-transpeptidase family protein [Reyranella sp.]|nr:L,D-transpeptidase family protein [Reyranella sp.]